MKILVELNDEETVLFEELKEQLGLRKDTEVIRYAIKHTVGCR